MPTANEEIQDRAIDHAVALERYSNNVVRRIMALLGRSDDRLSAELSKVLERIGPDSFSQTRLEALLTDVRKINKAAYESIKESLTVELKELAAYEASWQAMTIEEAVPVAVNVAAVSGEQVYAAAMKRPFQGVLLKGALDDVDAQTARRIRQTISQGIVEGRTTDQIVRDIRGTRAAKYKDGLLERSRRDVEAIVRTAIGHTTGMAQDMVMEANADIIKGVRWSATLDTRTSPTCRPRDGKLYDPVTHKPIGHAFPWLAGPGRSHWRCRSASVPVLKGWKELGFDPNIADTRASMDGQVPVELSYGDWLKKQSASRQAEVLGETRAKLFRNGGLKVEDMYSQRGQYLTLDELRERDKAAFTKAGVK